MSIMHSLARRYATVHPDAAAYRLQDLAPDEAATFLAALEPETAAAVIKEMWPRSAVAAIEHVTPHQAARFLEGLDLSRIVALLRLLPAGARSDILGALPRSIEPRVRKALSLPAGSVGSAADSAVTPGDADATVGEALKSGTDPRVPYLYVIDQQYRLVGVIHRRELELADEGASLRSIMNSPVQKVPATTPLAALHQHRAWSAFDALPVVDARDAFLGVIRHKVLRSASHASTDRLGPTTALTTLLDFGEVYWSGLFSAIEVLATGSAKTSPGDIP